MNGGYSVSIVGGAVVVVPGANGLAAHDDLVSSLFLAQLVANKKVEKKPKADWYDSYVGVLDGFWLRNTKAREDWFIPDAVKESVMQWVAAAISRVADDAPEVTATLARVANMPGTEPGMELLRTFMQMKRAVGLTGTMSCTAVRFLVVLAHSPDSFSSVYLELDTPLSPGPNPLGQQYGAEDVRGMVTMRYARANLSKSLYAPARDAIALKIKDRLAGNIMPLNLPKTI